MKITYANLSCGKKITPNNKLTLFLQNIFAVFGYISSIEECFKIFKKITYHLRKLFNL